MAVAIPNFPICHKQNNAIQKHIILIWLFTTLSLLLISSLTQAQPEQSTVPVNNHASILVYHHVSEATPPATSVSPTTFESHLAYLKQHHTVLPLDTIVNAIKSRSPLPDKAVAITFDDGYRNILENAHPLLKSYGMPYTIFVNTQTVGSRKNLLTWDELNEMRKDNVLIANHYTTHQHMLFKAENQSEEQWYEQHRSNIILAEQQLIAHLGTSPKLIAYPYGEFNQTLESLVLELDIVGFGQHSGAVSSLSNMAALPRFPAAGIYSNLKTLQVKLNSLAMPITQNSIVEPELQSSGITPDWRMTIETNDLYPSQVSCFYNSSTLETQWENNQVQITLPETLPKGRSRINCTAPSKTKKGRYYWYSQPFFVPNDDGSWPE